MFLWAYSGVDFSIPGTGGPACTNYLPNSQKIVETLLVLVIASLETWLTCPRLFPKKLEENGVANNMSVEQPCSNNNNNATRQLLLVVLCMVFGIEIGFKLASGQFIWILNPCHVVTMIQIYLLAAPVSKQVAVVFRIQIHLLSGVLIAVCFPVVNTRLLPFEVTVYWVQHLLLLFIPMYLMSYGAPYTVEIMSDFSWSVFVLGIQMAYHFLFLQAVSVITEVNLNNIVCPAVSDPFNGPYYRLWAVLHQSALILLHGKAYVLLACALRIPVTFSRHPCCPLKPKSFK